MHSSTHWRDLLIGMVGLWLIASPSLLGYGLSHAAALNAYGVGSGLIVFSIVSAWRLRDLGNEILNVVFGCWLVLSPFALGFSGQRAAALNAAAVGLIVASVALWDLFSS